MDAVLINTLTIGAAFSQSVVLAVTLFVFFKNLKEMKAYNEIATKRFNIQSKIEKFTLTLRFADWVKNELIEYIPFLNSAQKNAFLSKKEIEEHFEFIAKNTVALIQRDIIYRSLVLDELKKLSVVVGSYSKDKELLKELKNLFKLDQAWYERDKEDITNDKKMA